MGTMEIKMARKLDSKGGAQIKIKRQEISYPAPLSWIGVLTSYLPCTRYLYKAHIEHQGLEYWQVLSLLLNLIYR